MAKVFGKQIPDEGFVVYDEYSFLGHTQRSGLRIIHSLLVLKRISREKMDAPNNPPRKSMTEVLPASGHARK